MNPITLIERYQPHDPQQEILKTQFLQFIQANPTNYLERHNLTGHLTASAWILDRETRSQTVLVDHKKLNRWLQPGGHADGDSNLLTVALKETLEETGLTVTPLSEDVYDLDVHAIPWHKDVPPHLHFDVRFLLSASVDDTVCVSEESHQVRWISFNDLDQLQVDSSVLRLRNSSVNKR